MHDPIATGRRAAMRAVAIAAAAVGLVAAAFLLAGAPQALGAAVGGGAAVAGNAAATGLALGGGVRTARSAFARLLLGVAAKWLLMLAGVALALEAWRLPALPVVLGLVAGMAAWLLALRGVHRVPDVGRQA